VFGSALPRTYVSWTNSGIGTKCGGWSLEYTFDYENYRKIEGQGIQYVSLNLDGIDHEQPSLHISIETVLGTEQTNPRHAKVWIYRKGYIESFDLPFITRKKFYDFHYSIETSDK